MTNLDYADSASRLTDLQNRIHDLLAGEPKYGDMLRQIDADLAKRADDSDLRITFVGQYNAGKSSVIRALTGDQTIKVDSDVATDRTSEYRWNEIVLTDTPGIFAGRPDHDTISRHAMLQSDLLVYCLTYSLFDNILLADFLSLAFDRGYAKKMFLVINKMDSEDGDFQALEHAYRKTLTRQLAPHELASFSHAFIAAQLANDSDEEARLYSNFDEFVQGLNLFIRKNRLYSKITGPAQVYLDTVQGGLLTAEGGDDTHYHALLNRIERAALKAIRNADLLKGSLLRGLKSDILTIGLQINQTLGTETFQANLDSSPGKIGERCESLLQELASGLASVDEAYMDELQEIRQSDLGRLIFDGVGLSSGLPEIDSSPLPRRTPSVLDRFDSDKVKAVSDVIGASATGVVNATGVAAAQGFAKAAQASGSAAHQVILQVGGQLGLKFKPWQAVNLAKDIGNFAKSLGPFLAVLGVAIEVADVVQESKQQKARTEARQQVSAYFVEEADKCVEYFEGLYREYQNATYIENLQAIREDRQAKISAQKHLSTTGAALRDLCSEIRGIIVKGA